MSKVNEVRAEIMGRYYPDAQTALDAVLPVSNEVGRVYISEHKVNPGFEQHWPHPTYWIICTTEPWVGIQGAYYYTKPNFYVVQSGTAIFEQGDPPERIREMEEFAKSSFENTCNRSV